MNQVNFLPSSYLQQQARHGRRYRQAALLVLMFGCAIGWFVGARDRASELELLVAERQQEAVALSEQSAQLERAREQHQELSRQLHVRRELAQPVTHTALLAAISELMPPSVAFTGLQMTAEGPRPTRAAAAGKKATSKSKNATVVRIEPMKISVDGIAPTDAEIADLIGRLAEHPVFTDVKMLYSRSVQTAQVIGREFRLEMLVPLDREYVPVAPAGEGVAHAH